MKIHVIGFPGDVGGASTELWHTLKMWRAGKAQVTLTPTWAAPPAWIERVEQIGCLVRIATISSLRVEPDVVVISFCNSQFWPVMKRLARSTRNATVWVPCMNWLSDVEKRRYAQGLLPSAIVCQSEHQRSVLVPELEQFGLDVRVARIRGAFDASLYGARAETQRRGEEFVIGRISRAAVEKFQPDLWEVLEAVRDRLAPRPVVARVLGWRPLLARKLGEPPDWVETLGPAALGAAEFMGSLDCLYQSGRADENWPRVGLEAMAAGVPIVADNRAGWREMLGPERLGHLVYGRDGAVDAILRIARENQVGMITRARRAVETTHGNDGLWEQWKTLFDRIRR